MTWQCLKLFKIAVLMDSRKKSSSTKCFIILKMPHSDNELILFLIEYMILQS